MTLNCHPMKTIQRKQKRNQTYAWHPTMHKKAHSTMCKKAQKTMGLMTNILMKFEKKLDDI